MKSQTRGFSASSLWCRSQQHFKVGISVVRSADNSHGDVPSVEKDLRTTQRDFNLLSTEPEARLRTLSVFPVMCHRRHLASCPITANCCAISLVPPRIFVGSDSNQHSLKHLWAYLAADLSLSREATSDPVRESTTNKSTAASQEKSSAAVKIS